MARKKQKQDYHARGLELLKTFYNRLKDGDFDPKYLEKSFYLPLGNYKFTGKIDRADLANGGLKIIDYKTSEKIPSKNDKVGLDQLHVYQWAAEESLAEKVTGLTYWYLQEDKFLDEQPATAEKIAELKQRLLANIETIVDAVRFDRFKELHEQTKEHKCQFKDLE